MSKLQTASRCRCRCARATSSASVSWSAWRLPSPVSGSTTAQHRPSRPALRLSIAAPCGRRSPRSSLEVAAVTGGSSLSPNTVRKPSCPSSFSSGIAIADRIAALAARPRPGSGRRSRPPAPGCRPAGRRPLPRRDRPSAPAARPAAAESGTPSTTTATVAPATPWSAAAASAQRASTSSRSSACPSDSTRRVRRASSRIRSTVVASSSASASIRSPITSRPSSSRCSEARRERSTIVATRLATTTAATAARSARAAVLICVAEAYSGGRRGSSSATSWFLPCLLRDALGRSQHAGAARASVSAGRSSARPLDIVTGGSIDAERRGRHLELEPAVEQLRLLARRLRQDQEELVGAARVPEGGVAAADQLRGPARRTRPARRCRPRGSRVRLLIAPKSSRSIWIRQSGRSCRRAALISRGSASSKALALPRPVRESVAARCWASR